MTKFEKDFREWFIQEIRIVAQGGYDEWYIHLDFHDFNKNMPFYCKWGIYLDFFDQKGLIISITHWGGSKHPFNYELFIEERLSWAHDGINAQKFKTRNEAHKAAIKKAIEIYNQ